MIRDLFAHQDLGVFDISFTGRVNPSGGVLFLLLTPVSSSSSVLPQQQHHMTNKQHRAML